jgi:hypothetical protein
MNEPTPPEGASRLPESIDLDGLFTLYPQLDGSYGVEFGRLTAPREIPLRWKVTDAEVDLSFALLFIAQAGFADSESIEIPTPQPGFNGMLLRSPSNIHEIHRLATKAKHQAEFYKLILKKLSNSIGPDLESMRDPAPEAEAQKAKARIEKTVSNALDAIFNQSRRKAHGSAATVEVLLENGERRNVLLAWLALCIAKELVQKNQSLPSKSEVRLEIEERFPETRGLTSVKWSAVWRDSGLATLPKAQAWEHESRKRRSRTKTKSG